MAPPAPSPSSPQWQQQNGAGIPRTSTANPNHTQDPKADLSGGAYALAGQVSHESPARPLPGAAAEKGHGGSAQQMGGRSHPSRNPFMSKFDNPGARTLSVEEQRRLGQQWKAQGRKACGTCGKKHPPPCNPGIVKRRNSRRFETPWCKTCQEFHQYGRHVRTMEEAHELLNAQADEFAQVPNTRLVRHVTDTFKSKAVPETKADVEAAKAKRTESDEQAIKRAMQNAMHNAPEGGLNWLLGLVSGRRAISIVLPMQRHTLPTRIAPTDFAGTTYNMPQPPSQQMSASGLYGAPFDFTSTVPRRAPGHAQNNRPTPSHQDRKHNRGKKHARKHDTDVPPKGRNSTRETSATSSTGIRRLQSEKDVQQSLPDLGPYRGNDSSGEQT